MSLERFLLAVENDDILGAMLSLDSIESFDTPLEELQAQTLLNSIISRGMFAVAKEMIRRGANVNTVENDGYTSIHYACLKGYNDLIHLLIEAGANLNSQTDIGWTPLHLATNSGHLESMRILVDAGADVSLRHHFGLSPIDMANMKDNQDMIRLLTTQRAT